MTPMKQAAADFLALNCDGGCPCMFGPASDGGHRVMGGICSLTRAVPRRVRTDL